MDQSNPRPRHDPYLNGDRPPLPVWHGRVAGVRPFNGGLRWTLRVWSSDLETVAHVDTTLRGAVVDMQSDDYFGTCGDPALDELVVNTVRAAVAQRRVHQGLDDAERRRWGRVQGVADRRWAA